MHWANDRWGKTEKKETGPDFARVEIKPGGFRSKSRADEVEKLRFGHIHRDVANNDFGFESSILDLNALRELSQLDDCGKRRSGRRRRRGRR
jgi:hypothetical protein